MGYRDRAAAIQPHRPFESTLFSFGSILSNVVTVEGLVRGAWRRTITRDTLHLEIRLLDRLNGAETTAVEEAGYMLGRFLDRPVELTWL